MRTATISFRGEDREVEYTYEYDPSVGIDGVTEWSFTSPAPPEPTEAEYDEVANVLTFFARQDDLAGDDLD